MLKFSVILPLLLVSQLLITLSDGFSLQPRIINGVDSDIRQYPFFVQLQTIDASGNTKQCGASLISDG